MSDISVAYDELLLMAQSLEQGVQHYREVRTAMSNVGTNLASDSFKGLTGRAADSSLDAFNARLDKFIERTQGIREKVLNAITTFRDEADQEAAQRFED